MNLQRLLSYARKACDDYQMIKAGDKIAVGISGGKDSLSLLVGLREMQRFYPEPYELVAVTISLGLPGFALAPVRELCKRLGVRYSVVETDIAAVVFDERKEKNPCSLCAKMRKGALHDEAVRLGCNKVALGHNKDDVIHTFFLSLFYEGRVHTMSPVTYLDRKDLWVVRPLLYVPEDDVRTYVEATRLPVVKSPCPVDGYTKREEISRFVAAQRGQYDHFDEKIFGAIKRSELRGW